MKTEKKDYVKKFVGRSLRAALGLMVFACGVYAVIQANEGAAPWDVLNLGIVNRTGIIYGNVSIMISAVLIFIDIVVLKEKIGWGTILDAVVVGKTVDLLNWINVLPTMTGSIWMRILAMLIGFILEALGQYLYMKEGLSFGPRDTLQIGLGKLMPKIPIGFVNTIMLAVVLVVGWLLTGPVGIASILAPFGIGEAQNIIFRMAGFEPKEVYNESIIETWKKLTGKW